MESSIIQGALFSRYVGIKGCSCHFWQPARPVPGTFLTLPRVLRSVGIEPGPFGLDREVVREA